MHVLHPDFKLPFPKVETLEHLKPEARNRGFNHTPDAGLHGGNIS